MTAFQPAGRTSPLRDLKSAVDRHGNMQIEVTVGGRLSWANLPPAEAARFFRELADDAERAAPHHALTVYCPLGRCTPADETPK